MEEFKVAETFKVRGVFSHPVSGIIDITMNIESVETFKEQLKEHGCSVVFIIRK